MKKTYKSITTFIVLLSMLTLKMGAQLSGVVTINAGAPASATNYTTFTSLATTLNTGGISGPLTVNVVANSGPYNEQPSFGVIAGVSASNTITINGNGNTVSFTSTSSATPWTFNLNGTDRMNVNNLNVLGLGTYAYACVLSNGADFNTFSACTFSNPVNVNSTTQIPFLMSGVNTGITAANSANYCTVKSCTMTGGWYGLYMYGLTGAPYQTNNTVEKCVVRDYYYMGVYCYYQKNPIVRDCLSDRPTKTANYSTIYGYYLYASQGGLFERNRATQLFDGQQTSTTGCYGMFFGYTPVLGSDLNICRNNVICDIKSNGLIYGLYGYYPNGYVYHNTISLDHAGATGGTTYGLYMYGSSGYITIVKNNNVSITRGGTGTKYCYYSGGTTGNITLDKNNYYINSPAGTNNIGYYTGAALTLANLQAQGVEPNGMSINPAFAALPTNVVPTSATLNDQGTPVGVILDMNSAIRSGTTPDVGAYEFLTNACSGIPTASSVTTPGSPICPGTSLDLTISNYNPDAGITYQWVASVTSALGPWTVQPGATTPFFTTPGINQPMWYGLVMTCANAPGSNTVAGGVTIASGTTSTVPYHESFEGITKTNNLPNCSWYSPNQGVSALTYTNSNSLGRTPHTGNNFASFYYSPAGVSYYYTNGIQLSAGVTYSADLWYQTDYSGANNWSELSILVGSAQTSAGLTTIATASPALTNVYKQLGNTFTVATTGLYYIAVKANGALGNAQYLTWDDLSVTVPCSLNTPTVSIAANNTTICAGDFVTLNASGADTYMWNTGAITNIITEMPTATTLYNVVGTSALSGCSTTITQNVVVNPTPLVFVYAAKSTICAGQALNLSAVGPTGTSFMWSNNVSGQSISVSPTSNASYTLSGTGANGCIGYAVQAVSVQPAPVITVVNSQPSDMCIGDSQTLTGSGAISYLWVSASNGVNMIGNPLTISPNATTIYSVTGTDANGCVGKTTVTQNVKECVGLKENKLNGVSVYPNPTSGDITIELNNNSEKTVQVMDVTGRVISSSTSTEAVVRINLANVSNGIYYVKIQSNASVEVVKVVKQ